MLQLIMRQGMLVAAMGVGLGVLAALLFARLLGSLLYNVRPEDPVILGSVSLTLLIAALLATYLPARRAKRVNPVESLRAE